jgi:prepilin peptidase CpaA
LATASNAIVLAALCAGLGTAAAIDARHRRIPNAVSLAMACSGLILAATGASGISLASSVAGLVIGFVMMLPGHTLGATGAGDVKLFAAAGTLLGAGKMLPAFVCVALAGGVLALGIAWHRGRLGRTMSNTARLCGGTQPRTAIESPKEHNKFPYGPAIAAGCLIAALVQ